MAIGIPGTLTWCGHAAFRLVTDEGSVIYIDPWLTGNPACPDSLRSPDRCDVILITHGHGDHVGDTVAIAKRLNAAVVAMVEVASWLTTKGLQNIVGMNKGGTVEVAGIAVTMVHAYHSSSIHDGERTLYGGEAAGFIVRLPGGFTLYHAGDTNVFGDMRLIRELYSPSLALLPIGGHYTMSPHEAALAVRLLGADHIVPMHHGTFPLLTGSPAELAQLLAPLDNVQIHAMRPGETLR